MVLKVSLKEGFCSMESLIHKCRDASQLLNWTEKELGVLISFLMLHTNGKSWVAHKDS